MDVRWIILTFLATNAGICIVADLALQPEGSEHAYFTSENFIMTCSARDKDTTKLRWHGPSGEITDLSGRIHVEQASNHVELRLVWESVESEDAGMYKCTGDADDEEIAFQLIVYGSINFAKVEREQHGKEGGNLTVVCDAYGKPMPTISWKFKDASLPLPYNQSIGIKHETTGNELKIYNLKREDAGNYTCSAMIVTVLASQIKDINIMVQVQYGPEWRDEITESPFSGVGHAINLTCEADAEPSPIFEWRRNEETIQASNSYVIHNQHNKTMLQVLVHNESLFGDYECVAKNPLGDIKKHITLKQGNPPSPPSFDVVSDEPGTLTLNIAPPAESMLEVNGYKVEYKLLSKTWDNVQTIEFDKGLQYTLKNLRNDADYVVRVAARNKVGYGEYSKETTTKTKDQNSDTVNDSAFCSQSSAVAALLSTSVSLWVLRL